MQAYTYLIRHKATGKLYYGCRKSTTFDLFESYFTSSKLIKRMIDEEGIEAFEYELRRKFDSYPEARNWETKVLSRLRVCINEQYLNQAVSSPRLCLKDSVQENIRKQKLSVAMKKRWEQPEFQALFQTEEMRAKRSEFAKRPRKPRVKKDKKKPIFKHILIQRDGKVKSIPQNFLSAYKKYGWSSHGESNPHLSPI